MALLYLIRHGRAAQNWSSAPDPGLDGLGKTQARARADALSARLAPLPIVSSPLRRCRETADFLAKRWKQTPQIEPRVREIPSPELAPAERSQWLRRVLRQNWDTLPPEDEESLQAWRTALLAAVLAYKQDMVIFSHFVAINVAVGAALDDGRLVCFYPANASCTVMESDGQSLRLLEQGEEDRSVIQ